MKFEEWFPYYQDIRNQFGYSTQKDQEAAEILSKIIEKRSLKISKLEKKILGKNVMAIGVGQSLDNNLEYIKKNKNYVKIASDAALEILIRNKIKPDIVITDLDNNPSFLKMVEKFGAIIIIHAHEDNIDLVKKLVPKFKNVIGSTQVMPLKNVYNFGGFTDGDRCVFLAEEMKAKTITLIGMDFDSDVRIFSKDKQKQMRLKKEKMQVAKRLLIMLARRTNSRLYNRSTTAIKGIDRVSLDNIE